MKVNGVLALSFGSCVYSQAIRPSTIVARDTAGSFTQIGQEVAQLDHNVQGFSGDIGPMSKAADQLVATIKQTTDEMNAAASMGNAFAMYAPAMTVNTNSKKLVDDLKAKKAAIAQAGACDQARDKIAAISVGADGLMAAIVKKQPMAEGKGTNYVKDMLAGVSAEFSPQSCVNGQVPAAPAAPAAPPVVAPQPAAPQPA